MGAQGGTYLAGLISGIAIVLLGLFTYQVAQDNQHFQLHYTGIPYNPTCHTIGQDLWDCERIR
jgi:hypothetical protein